MQTQTARRTSGWPAAVALLAAERDRWILWLPVTFGVGIAAYFAFPVEPWHFAGAFAVAVTVALAFAFRSSWPVLLAFILGATFSLGFAAAQLRTAVVAAPVILEERGPAKLAGTVLEVERRVDGWRLLIRPDGFAGVPAGSLPARARVSLRDESGGEVRPGDRVIMTAVLRPPPAPSMPGAFDFARHAYFEGLGAVGFVMGSVSILPGRIGRDASGSGLETIQLELAAWRAALSARVREVLSGQRGAVAAALMTGERGAISDDALADMRDSGLAHLLAISGLHLGLVAGLVFFGLRAILAVFPRIAVTHHIKKWAAAAAIVAAFAYLLLVGAPVSAQRAFVMVSLAFFAVLTDRVAISMHVVGWAALVVLAVAPEALLSAGFQMSFAAVGALVAFFETFGRQLGGEWREERRRWPNRLRAYAIGLGVTSIVAILATAPFAAFHFNRLALYGLVGNMVAVPLTAFWIMPLAVLAYLLMPFGAEELALVPLGVGIEVLLTTAATIADWSGATVILPSMPLWGLAALVAAGLWLLIWQRPWRLWSLPLFALGLSSLWLAEPPDLLVNRDADLFAVRHNGGLALSRGRGQRFERELWLRRAGQQRQAPLPYNLDDRRETGGAGVACDDLGCVVSLRGRIVALARDGRALHDDCRVADIVVAAFAVRENACLGPAYVLDIFDLRRAGGVAIHMDRRLRIETVNGRRGERPWVQRPWDRWRSESGATQ